MKPKPTYTARQRDAAVREAIGMTTLWDSVEIVDGVITGHLVVRPENYCRPNPRKKPGMSAVCPADKKR